MQASKNTDTTSIRQARDIIARWSSSDLLDQISALPPLPPLPKPHFPRLNEPVDSVRSSYRAAGRPQPEAKQDWSEDPDEQPRTTARSEQQSDLPNSPEDQSETKSEKPAATEIHESTEEIRFADLQVDAAPDADAEREFPQHSHVAAADMDQPTSVDLEFGDDEDNDADFADVAPVSEAAGYRPAAYPFAAVGRPEFDSENQTDKDQLPGDKLTNEPRAEDEVELQQNDASQNVAVDLTSESDVDPDAVEDAEYDANSKHQ